MKRIISWIKSGSPKEIKIGVTVLIVAVMAFGIAGITEVVNRHEYASEPQVVDNSMSDSEDMLMRMMNLKKAPMKMTRILSRYA